MHHTQKMKCILAGCLLIIVIAFIATTTTGEELRLRSIRDEEENVNDRLRILARRPKPTPPPTKKAHTIRPTLLTLNPTTKSPSVAPSKIETFSPSTLSPSLSTSSPTHADTLRPSTLLPTFMPTTNSPSPTPTISPSKLLLYLYNHGPVTFIEAMQRCKGLGSKTYPYASLATIRTKDDLDLLRALYATAHPGGNGAWIGGKRVSGTSFVWLDDGAPITFTNWRLGEPANAGGHEDCIIVDANVVLDWNDVPCDQTFDFICEVGNTARFPAAPSSSPLTPAPSFKSNSTTVTSEGSAAALTGGQIAGIVIGVLFGCGIIVLIFLYFWKRGKDPSNITKPPVHQEAAESSKNVQGDTADVAKPGFADFAIADQQHEHTIPMAETVETNEKATSMATTSAALSKVPAMTTDTKPKTVMISYQWDSKELALRVFDFLKGKGIEVIIDDVGIHGDLLDWMAHSVAASEAIILLLTHKYENSKNCRAEAEYAYELNKKILPLVGEVEYTAGSTWLSILISGKYRYNVLGAFEAEMNKLVQRELK
jgi:hypothetical protein